MIIQDSEQRLQALDPRQSFIVQAPAGSGKTELLTQRFLVLLGEVKFPEEILAITFTKKSAAEMRTRIINALKNAANDQPPESPHAQKTWELARKVLRQDQKLNWNLLATPNRLRLQTIDSFNASITRQLPILSQFGATPDIANDAHLLYRQAVQAFLTHLEENHAWSEAIATIVLHMDNDLARVENLLINLLAKRDQWLRYTVHADFNRAHLEKNLASITLESLTRILDAFPKQHTQELLFLLRLAAYQLQQNSSTSSIVQGLAFTELPQNTLTDRAAWLIITDFLLTQNNTWRSRLDKNIGFLPASALKNPAEKEQADDAKQRMKALLQHLAQAPRLLDALIELRNAPAINYRESQWQVLAALLDVLKIATAQLKVIFQEHAQIDYIENALAAAAALGTPEAPTDLTLALDYQIKHILIDEFQDTSNSQYQLLRKLTAGWEPNDGRTLFLVGDPMQSIYRFREAEVGIFIRARQYGIGTIQLTPLTLCVNFRSTKAVVDWVNTHFQQVFPPFDDIATGAVSYSPSLANKAIQEDYTAVSLNTFDETDETAQAQAIARLIQTRKRDYPEQSIAILVRSRSHLKYIIPALKKAALTYRAIDIDPLSTRPVIQDLMALTRALVQPADRIAWLALLRAPWCGLTLSDLLLLSGTQKEVTLWERLQCSTVLLSLSLDGQHRLKRIIDILKIKLYERCRVNLRYWIESTWLLLGGPACVAHAAELTDTEAYFSLLEKLDQGGQLTNLDRLDEYVHKLFAASNTQADASLQIMTIHNAKGLEFDTVILPHLERKASMDDKQLLLWLERPEKNDNSRLLLAPVHGAGEEQDSIYEYIKRQHAIKNDYECGRLLYVAATRAKKYLDLFFTVKAETKPNNGSLLEKLWAAINHQVIPHETSPAVATSESLTQFIQRLSTDWQNPLHENRANDALAYHQTQIGFHLPNYTLKHIGTLTHQIFQQIAQLGFAWWQDQSLTQQAAYIKKHLYQLGVLEHELTHAQENIQTAVQHILNDSRGQWILAPHPEAQAEFKLTALIDDQPKELIIDRTFVDENNIRWIIDYKTSTHRYQTIEQFLAKEKEKYTQQLWSYHQAIRQMDERMIRVGLYFPLIQEWCEWEFDSVLTGERPKA